MEENFARAHKSFLYVENITLSGYNFQDTLCTVEESNVTLFETKFYRNWIPRMYQSELKCSHNEQQCH